LLYSYYVNSDMAMAKLIQMNPHLWGRLRNTGRTCCCSCGELLPFDGEVHSVKQSGKKKNYIKKYYCIDCGDVLNL